MWRQLIVAAKFSWSTGNIRRVGLAHIPPAVSNSFYCHPNVSSNKRETQLSGPTRGRQVERSFPGGIRRTIQSSIRARRSFVKSIWRNRIDRVAPSDGIVVASSQWGYKAILLAGPFCDLAAKVQRGWTEWPATERVKLVTSERAKKKITRRPADCAGVTGGRELDFASN